MYVCMHETMLLYLMLFTLGRIERHCPVCYAPTAMRAKHLRRKQKNLNEEEIWGYIYQARKKYRKHVSLNKS